MGHIVAASRLQLVASASAAAAAAACPGAACQSSYERLFTDFVTVRHRLSVHPCSMPISNVNWGKRII